MMSDAAVPGLTCPADATPDACEAEPPASLTPAAYQLLRSEPYGWKGVIVTDTLSGGAILYNGRTVEQAAQEAVAAGADLIEFKPTPPPDAPTDWAPTAEDNVRTIDAAIAAIKAWAGTDPAAPAPDRAIGRPGGEGEAELPHGRRVDATLDPARHDGRSRRRRVRHHCGCR